MNDRQATFERLKKIHILIRFIINSNYRSVRMAARWTRLKKEEERISNILKNETK